jgi:hypothetical protein
MSYGKVISGGKQMSKGLTKGINEKREEFMESKTRAKTLATSVQQAFTKNNLSENQTQDVNGRSFKTPKVPSKV